MSPQSNILLLKLDEFIRKYYRNRVIKGSLYSAAILLAAFLSVVVLEYAGEFGMGVRRVLFFSFVTTAIYVLVSYIIYPLLKMRRIGKVISYDQAAEIIGDHFSNVRDKLLNALQLQNNRTLSASAELLLAGVNQKTEELAPVQFTAAIDLRENSRYLRYVLPPLVILLLLFAFRPEVISKSTDRLMHYNVFFEKEMPFRMNISNPKLEAMQSKDFPLHVKVTGNQLPDEMFIVVNGVPYKMSKNDKLNFSYNFTNVQQNTNFQLSAAGYTSADYTLAVLPKPSLMRIGMQIQFPSYIHRAAEQLENAGDVEIPQGAKITWQFNTMNTEEVSLRFSDSADHAKKNGENRFMLTRRIMKSSDYTIRTSNRFVPVSPDSVTYGIKVVNDQFPQIDAEGKTDSLNVKNIYYSGQIRDDYGFSSLSFHWKKTGLDSNGRSIDLSGEIPLPLQKDGISMPFFYLLDASQYQLSSGDRLEYYFEVRDNDGVNGAKSSRTRMMEFKAPTRDEISKNVAKNSEEIKKDLEDAIKKSRQLQKDIQDLSRKMSDKKQPGYEEKKKLEELLKKQQELQDKISKIRQQNEMNNKMQNEFSKTDESIMEKQKELEQLFDNVMTPEMKKLFEELNKMLDKLDKNTVQEKLDEMKLSNKDIEKELDRNLEVFRQLEVAQKMQDAIDKLQELRNKEEELQKETSKGEKWQEKSKEEIKDSEKNKDAGKDKETENREKNADQQKGRDEAKKEDNKKADPKELLKKQEEIKKDFEDLKKDLKDLEEKNKNLEEPNKIPDTGDKQQKASEQMQKSSDQLGKNDKKNASQSQKDAAKEMEKMQEEMEQAMSESESEQQSENAEALRQILENLLNLSFSQEDLMKTLDATRIDNPKYTSIPKAQNKLKDDSKIIEDSLLALSKRAPQISAIVNREISGIHSNMEKTVKHLAERNPDQSKMRMQMAMKSVNDLAALLHESLEQMQNQMKQQMQAKNGGKCKKPGKKPGNSPGKTGNSVQSMRQMQERLNQQLKDLKEALEKGQKPGEKPGEKKGQKPGEGKTGNEGKTGMQMPGNSEQFAKLAAQQKALRLQMEQMMDKLKNKGKNPGGEMSNLMEETEKDLVNKQLNSETMRRQQEILTRLLESEKAEKEREQDEQRKSNEGKVENLRNPERFLEYKRIKEKEMELLQTLPPSLTPYYKDKVNQYFNNLSK
jgi:hypothetical protein